MKNLDNGTYTTTFVVDHGTSTGTTLKEGDKASPIIWEIKDKEED